MELRNYGGVCWVRVRRVRWVIGHWQARVRSGEMVVENPKAVAPV